MTTFWHFYAEFSLFSWAAQCGLYRGSNCWLWGDGFSLSPHVQNQLHYPTLSLKKPSLNLRRSHNPLCRLLKPQTCSDNKYKQIVAETPETNILVRECLPQCLFPVCWCSILLRKSLGFSCREAYPAAGFTLDISRPNAAEYGPVFLPRQWPFINTQIGFAALPSCIITPSLCRISRSDLCHCCCWTLDLVSGGQSPFYLRNSGLPHERPGAFRQNSNKSPPLHFLTAGSKHVNSRWGEADLFPPSGRREI